MELGSWLCRFSLVACVGACLMSCHRQTSSVEERMQLRLSRHVYKELQKKPDTSYRAAADYLFSSLSGQYHYEGEPIDQYDALFDLLDSLHRDSLWNDEGYLQSKMESLAWQYGPLEEDERLRTKDLYTLTPQFLTNHILQAVDIWQSSAWYDSVDFTTFCEFILPYKAGQEYPEEYQSIYRERYAEVRDTARSLFEATKAIACDMLARGVFSSSTMWDYPYDLSMSKIELGKRGSCRHLVNYGASVLRANGIPAAVDYVSQWGNRSSGHVWNVLLMPGDSIYPFEAPTTSYFPRLKFSYKPAKIFRRMYRPDGDVSEDEAFLEQVPDMLLSGDRDVTHQYVTTYDIRIPAKYRASDRRELRYGIIAVFDNRQWVPVDWGTVDDTVMCFRNMAADILYLGCSWQAGRMIPLTDPFILQPDGSIRSILADTLHRQEMRLERKYPIFRRVAGYMAYVKWSRVEVADNADFESCQSIFTVNFVPDKYKDTTIQCPKPHRYVRFRGNPNSTGDVAEVEFYGRKSLSGPEVRLSGTLLGQPQVTAHDLHPYTHAVDGNPGTYFAKSKGTEGWVGYDLGEAYYVTRVRFCPRSDTNFIMPGDRYELCWWNGTHWESCGLKQAETQEISFQNVPSEGLYLLHDRTQGQEERIFIYRDGQQVFY